MLKNLQLLMMLLAMGLFATAGCGVGVDDDDDSAVGDDDDSAAGDDDDTAVGDDDDSAAGPEALELGFTAMNVTCEGSAPSARDQTSTYTVTIDFEGWASDVQMYMWDGFPYEGAHWIDASQPFAMTNTDYDDYEQWDQWQAVYDSYDTIGEADANDGTIMDCFDSNSNSQVEDHNYTVCATDYLDDMRECYFCGGDNTHVDLGAPASSNGTVGQFDDGTIMEPAPTTHDCTYQATLL